MLLALALLPSISVIPNPLSISSRDGSFELKPDLSIVASKDVQNEADYLRDLIRPATGLDAAVTQRGGDGNIHLLIDTKLAKLGSEGYTLDISPKRITIKAFKHQGVFYGIQTLRQILPSDIERRGRTGKSPWTVPCTFIEDSPRFSWRGSHLDVSRHFMPKEFVMKYLELMALHKLNVFHWHLTDDQGWRIEIKKYPKLTSVGGFRERTMLKYDPPVYEERPHGGFYTQDDIREVVAFAARRHITVVPEIEMPGHAQAAIAAYPELGNVDKPIPVADRWGVISNVFNVEDSTINFLKGVLTEVIDLFPSKFIHIGGDECPKEQWKESAKAQARMKSLGLKDEHELQSWFIRQMDQFLDSKNRRLIGWSEILEGGLAPGAALMVWLGNEGAMQAVSSGHDVVMAQTTHTYLDYYQSKDRTREPHAIGGYLPIDQVYAYEPILPTMTEDHVKHVLGVQYQLWTEYIRDPKHVEYMAFPRGSALAEVAWSSKERRNYEDFARRLPSLLQRLKVLDVNFRKLD